MARTLSLSVILVAAVALSGCGILFPSARDKAAKNTPDFKSGYSDGCASATQQDTNYRQDQVRDEALYKSSKDYRAGWGSGFYNCRTNVTHNTALPGVGPIPDNNPGSHPY